MNSVDEVRDVFMVHVNSAGSVFVKTLDYFREQGGFKDDWGKRWVPIVAMSIEHARYLGCKSLGGARPYDQQPVEPEDRWVEG